MCACTYRNDGARKRLPSAVSIINRTPSSVARLERTLSATCRHAGNLDGDRPSFVFPHAVESESSPRKLSVGGRRASVRARLRSERNASAREDNWTRRPASSLFYTLRSAGERAGGQPSRPVPLYRRASCRSICSIPPSTIYAREHGVLCRTETERPVRPPPARTLRAHARARAPTPSEPPASFVAPPPPPPSVISVYGTNAYIMRRSNRKRMYECGSKRQKNSKTDDALHEKSELLRGERVHVTGCLTSSHNKPHENHRGNIDGRFYFVFVF